MPNLDDPLQQYASTQRAAMLTAAAVVAARRRPEHRLGRRARVRGVWDLLPEVAPEFAEYAAYFQDTSIKRVRAEAGIPGAVGIHDLADALRIATTFVHRVQALDDIKTSAQAGNADSAATVRRTS